MITPSEISKFTRDVCGNAPVIPVLVVEDPATAVPLAEALVTGGLPVLEVTLRTEAALEVVREMAQVTGAIVGAGTVLTPQDAENALQAGATFAVSPGATDSLLDACEEMGLPLLPGAVTASEAMRLLERGYEVLKFFPAEAVGGAKALKSLAGPLPQIQFCPTGGIGPNNAPDYLALDTVTCVGGSWVATKELIENADWDVIRDLAQAAAKLV